MEPNAKPRRKCTHQGGVLTQPDFNQGWLEILKLVG